MKKFLVSSFALMCAFSAVSAVSVFAASEGEQVESAVVAQDEENVMPYAEVTGYKYKMVNGIIYKRLWSYTYNEWVDSVWHL